MHQFYLGATDYIVMCEIGGCVYFLTLKDNKFRKYWHQP